MGRFQDLTVLVTGATGGFGRRTAERFAADGARLVLSDLQDGPLEDLAAFARAYRELPEYGTFEKVDASVPGPELARRLAAVVRGLGRAPAEGRHPAST